ncbi:MAG: flagellar FlbD family protein [Gaiella sp.]
MIPVHRLTHPDETVWINSDLIMTVENNPDTVICLTNGARLVVHETPPEVVDLVRDWRAGMLARAAEPETMKKVVALPIT